MLKIYKNRVLDELKNKGYNRLDFLQTESSQHLSIYKPKTQKIANYTSENMTDEKSVRLAAIRAANAAKSRQQNKEQADFENKYEETTRDFSVFTLSFRGTSLSFDFLENPQSYHSFSHRYTRFTPDFSKTRAIAEFLPLEKIFEPFHTWLDEHVKIAIDEELEPDLWSDIYGFQDLIGGNIIKTHDTSPFSDQEVAIIEVALKRFHKIIKDEFKPNEIQLHEIQKSLDYLNKSTKTSKKFDWVGLVISTLIGIITNLTLDIEQGRYLYHLFLQALESAQYLLE